MRWPRAKQWRCPLLPQATRLEDSSFCSRRRDLVDVQSEESHAGAEENHKHLLSAEGHQVALHNFVKYCNCVTELRRSLLFLLRRKTEKKTPAGVESPAFYCHDLPVRRHEDWSRKSIPSEGCFEARDKQTRAGVPGVHRIRAGDDPVRTPRRLRPLPLRFSSQYVFAANSHCLPMQQCSTLRRAARLLMKGGY